MKNKFNPAIYILFAALSFSACEKTINDNIRPSNDRADVELLSTLDGLTTASNGNYSLLVTNAAGETQYVMNWFNMSELKGNTLMPVTQAYPQGRSDAYVFANSPSFGVTGTFWRMSYRAIFGANKIIDAVGDGMGANYDQLRGENYFLRALVYFNLVRVYGRPYYQTPETSLGVPLSLKSIIPNDYKPARNTVKEVYDQIVSDLEKAATLMTLSKGNNYAGKEAAWALLSRVYLYMGGSAAAPNAGYNEKAVEYADMVINANKFTLLQGSSYSQSFAIDSKTNKEFIFCLRHDDTNGNMINEFLMPRDVYGSPYQGEYAASPDYLSILNENNTDLRKNFLTLSTDKRITAVDKSRYSINKFNYQQIAPAGGFDFSARSRSGTPILRFAEMYLNKAEALAKLGRNNDALLTLNVVRSRAQASVWTEASLSEKKLSVLDAVLRERQLELAGEGHSSYDNFRNGRPMVRKYADYSAAAGFTINADDKRVVYPLPTTEIVLNTALEQNPL